MTELELQSEYVMDFFCRRADGLGFREIKNNAVSPDLFIPANLYEFLKENSRKAWNNLLKKRIQWRRAKIASGHYGYDSRED